MMNETLNETLNENLNEILNESFNISNFINNLNKLSISIYNIFFISGIFVTSVSITCVWIGCMLHFNIQKEYNNMVGYDSDSETDSETEKEYENKYLNNYNTLEYLELGPEILKTLKTVFVEDETPRGVVKINYDIDLNAFTYYSDSKDIPYSYLETLGRLFVIKNNCKCIFIDYNEEKLKNEKEKEEREREKEKEKEEKEREKEKEKEEKKENNVFASLKQYQILDKKEAPIISIKTNHYIYKGKLREYKEVVLSKPINDEFEHIDYNTFKNMTVNEKKNL